MQRLHENDLAGHAAELEDWTVLCLPERFETGHPYAWRGERVHPAVAEKMSGTELAYGDPRDEGELIWPGHRDERQSEALARSLTSYRAAGQLQQRPAAREGQILKVSWWRFYDPRIRERETWAELPNFGMVVISADTPLKDKESNDLVAIQCYGIRGADRYLLDLRKGHMNYPSAKRAIKEMAQWARRHWPRCPHYVLIENAGYGPELIVDLKREITGVTKIDPGKDGDKEIRAESASDALESGNVFLPGFGPPAHPIFDEARTPADVSDFVFSCSQFPFAIHDDDVDAWSQVMNWLRGRTATPMRTSSSMKRRAPS
jgi:predicted phage terminase large subunit-like protein